MLTDEDLAHHRRRHSLFLDLPFSLRSPMTSHNLFGLSKRDRNATRPLYGAYKVFY
jgi:hypothetical protein